MAALKIGFLNLCAEFTRENKSKVRIILKSNFCDHLQLSLRRPRPIDRTVSLTDWDAGRRETDAVLQRLKHIVYCRCHKLVNETSKAFVQPPRCSWSPSTQYTYQVSVQFTRDEDWQRAAAWGRGGVAAPRGRRPPPPQLLLAAHAELPVLECAGILGPRENYILIG